MPPPPLPIDAANSTGRATGEAPNRVDRRVLLICPPFHDATLSSLSTAQLATWLRDQQVECAEAYFHLQLAQLVGLERYQALAQQDAGWGGELLMAEALHGEISDADLQRRVEQLAGPPAERRAVLQRFKQICLDRIREVRPEVVGLTTSCNQLMAALWLARCIKQESPEVTTVLGGSACSEPMGTEILAAYPEVDHVVSGYGEQPLLGLARGADPAARLVENCTPVDSDAAPIPDYGPFLRELATVDVDPRLALAFQSSRGCWWGRKHHCRFCGVNGTQMGYRTKSDARVIQEIRSLWEKHGRNLFATDAILSRQHLQRVVPELSRFEEGPKIFYELKTNLTQAEVAALGRAGVVGQLGVESLNTRLLKLLDKGVSAITNVAVLKWCRERKVAVSWNLLCAIPGEQTEDYEAQIRLMQGIPHLPPPARVNPIHLCRFSPYFDEFHEYGWTDIEPRREYRVMHPHLGDDALRRIAYHFEGVGGVSAAAYQERLESAVQRWQERCRAGDGLFLDPRQGLVRNDGDVGRRFNLDGPLGRIIECTHDIAPVRRVLGHARCARSVLEQMADHGLLFIEGDRVVNLAVRTHLPDQP